MKRGKWKAQRKGEMAAVSSVENVEPDADERRFHREITFASNQPSQPTIEPLQGARRPLTSAKERLRDSLTSSICAARHERGVQCQSVCLKGRWVGGSSEKRREGHRRADCRRAVHSVPRVACCRTSVRRPGACREGECVRVTCAKTYQTTCPFALVPTTSRWT
jgi:hypothetical protein